jgi:hypothetical protein
VDLRLLPVKGELTGLLRKHSGRLDLPQRNKKIASPINDSFVCRLKRNLKINRSVYVIALFCLSWYFIFCYLPIGGILVAFKNYRPFVGIWKSEWVGLRYFQQFFSSIYIGRLIRNTLLINFYSIIFGFPAPIILALLLNELSSNKYKRKVGLTCTNPTNRADWRDAIKTLRPDIADKVKFTGLQQLIGPEGKPYTAQDNFINIANTAEAIVVTQRAQRVGNYRQTAGFRYARFPYAPARYGYRPGSGNLSSRLYAVHVQVKEEILYDSI